MWHTQSWRWFRNHLIGLLSTDTPLSRYFAPPPADPKPPEVPIG